VKIILGKILGNEKKNELRGSQEVDIFYDYA